MSMVFYVAFLRGVNVAGNWVKMEDIRKRLMSAGFTDVQTYIQSGNIFFTSKDKDEQALQDKIAKIVTQLTKTEVQAAVFERVHLHVLLSANPFEKTNAKPEDKKSIIFLMKEPKNAKLPLHTPTNDVEIFYLRNRIALGISRKRNGKYTYPTALVESKWSVPATTRFWHTFENMLNEMD